MISLNKVIILAAGKFPLFATNFGGGVVARILPA
jgi:hypothetical protein